MPPRDRILLLSARAMEAALDAMAARIAAGGLDGLALVGVRRRGVPLARRLAARLAVLAGGGPEPPVGELDITLYRDDLVEHAGGPVTHASRVPFALAGRRVVLVDDVLYTGRTALAALTALTDLGRPARVELAVLVDRGHRELPVVAAIVGRRVRTRPEEWVEVHVREVDGEDAVHRFAAAPAGP